MDEPSIRKSLGQLLEAGMPALHFIALGTLLFAGSLWWKAPPTNTTSPTDRPRLVIPASRLAEAEQTFRAEHRRAPTVTEKKELIDVLIDEEILFHHALRLGLHRSEVPQRRLAQIASFVEPARAAPGSGAKWGTDRSTDGSIDETTAAPELARRAVELGLHEGDFVTRRVLVDAARRLIRGAARLVEPDEESVARYLRTHGERFRREDRYRISQVFQSRSTRAKPGDDAAALLARLRRDGVSPDNAAALSDPGIVPPSLPLLGTRALERRFGRPFVADLATLPVGQWTGPVASRHGTHLVFLHEALPGNIPEMSEVRGEIRALLREEAADRWLAARLRQLREGYHIALPTDARGKVTHAEGVS